MTRSTWAIHVLWAALVVPGMISRGFWNPDEGRYAEIAREVWQADGALVLTIAGETYAEKPPLFFWTVAAAQMIGGGPSAPASRVPSALATLFSALLLFSLVRRNFGEKEGTWAAFLFLVAQLVFQMAGWVGIDALASLFVILAVVAQDRALAAPARAARWRVLMYLALAAVILTKGAPVLIALAALGGRAWFEGGPRALFPRHLLWGVPLVLLTCAAWAVPAGLAAGWDHVWHLTGGQASRRLVASDSHRRPIWYYLVRIPAHFLPAAVLLPAGIRLAVLEWRAGGVRRASIGPFVLWIVIPFILFSLVSGKRERYLLPVFPALAALCGIAAVRYGTGPAGRAFVRRPLKAALAVLGLAGLVVAVLPFVFGGIAERFLTDLDGALRLEIREAIAAGRFVLVLGGLSAAAAAAEGIFARRIEPPVVPLAAAVAFLALALGAGALPALDRAKSAEPFVTWAEAKAPPDARWGVVKLDPGAICIVLRTADVRVFDAEEGKDAEAYDAAIRAALDDPDLVLVAERDRFERMKERSPEAEWVEIHERGVGRRTLVAFRAK